MRLILPQGVVDFDTLGAMLGAFLLDTDTIVLAPERYTEQCQQLAALYTHKLPFVPREKWFHPDKKNWKLPLWSRMALGMDFLQSLQIAKWLKEKNTQLDPFYASMILLGVYSTVDRLDSFSIDDEVHGVVDYLTINGADEGFVQHWLTEHNQSDVCQPECAIPVLKRMPLAKTYQGRVKAWHQALERVIFDQAWELGFKIFLVGGVTRDLLLDRSSRDMDFIVEGSAPMLAKAMESRYGGKVVTHTPFGTARWDLLDAVEMISGDISILREGNKAQFPTSIDFISARTEWYPSEGQLPLVRFDGIELDMQRRDFSINTLALRVDGSGYTLMDACRGLADLDNRIIRALHPRSFIDDPTRLFRAVRYEQRLGFKIEPQTEHWMQPGLESLSVVSGDRIRHELNLLMAEPVPWQQFRRAEQLGLLQSIHPAWGNLKKEWQAPLHAVLCEDFPELWQLDHQLDHLSFRELMGYAVLFQNLTAAEVCSIGERLLFSSEQVRQLSFFIECLSLKQTLKKLSASEFTFRLDKLQDAMLYVLLMLWLEDHELRDKIINLHAKWRKVSPIINGNDLNDMDIPPGPLYTRLLNNVRAARIDGLLRTKENEIAWVRKLLHEWGIKG
jgi:tRNA nucleotidyltransferase (CCA-adding enzyme)